MRKFLVNETINENRNEVEYENLSGSQEQQSNSILYLALQKKTCQVLRIVLKYKYYKSFES